MGNQPTDEADEKDKFSFIKKINPKIWIPILVIVFISGIILALAWNGSIDLRVDSRQLSDATDTNTNININTATERCGDGICDGKEKINSQLCPRDCGNPSKTTGSAMVGFLGCSITHNAVDGYEKLGGVNFWDWNQSKGNFGGGCVSIWNDQLNESSVAGKNYWELFRNLVKENPRTTKIWWELCSCSEVEKMEYDDFLGVLAKIKEIAPGREIYVSSMPIFTDTAEGICKSGVDKISNNVTRMIRDRKVSAGPTLSALVKSQTATDGCHATDEGKIIWGQDLKNFFDGK